MEPLTDKAQEELTTWLAETLVTNPAQIRQRRDKFFSSTTLSNALGLQSKGKRLHSLRVATAAMK